LPYFILGNAIYVKLEYFDLNLYLRAV